MRKTVVFLTVLAVAVFGWNASTLAETRSSDTSEVAFSDVPADYWAYEQIMALHQRNVITGYGDGTFRPNVVVLRGEFAKMMVLALNLSLADAASPTFVDVPTDNWAYRYVETAREYLTGFRTTRGDYFKPLSAVVREDMAVALVKALGYASEAEDEEALDEFADKSAVSPELRGYVAAALKKGLMAGYPDEGAGRTFKPMGLLTRAEAATLLYKLVGPETEVKVTYDSGAGKPGTSTSGSHEAPKVTAVVKEERIVLSWQPILDKAFQGYKVVISREDSHPAYPDDGYLYYITDRYKTSAEIDNEEPYKSGDFGQYLTPGKTYYFSVTALYDEEKVAGNALELTYPATARAPGSSGEHPAPEVAATVSGGKVLVTWKAITDSRFQGCKVVISRNDSSPAYPENGHLYYITDKDVTSATVDNIQSYNGGDFGGHLTPGQAYYFSVTALYDDCKVAGNAVRLVYPGP